MCLVDIVCSPARSPGLLMTGQQQCTSTPQPQHTQPTRRHQSLRAQTWDSQQTTLPAPLSGAQNCCQSSSSAWTTLMRSRPHPCPSHRSPQPPLSIPLAMTLPTPAAAAAPAASQQLAPSRAGAGGKAAAGKAGAAAAPDDPAAAATCLRSCGAVGRQGGHRPAPAGGAPAPRSCMSAYYSHLRVDRGTVSATHRLAILKNCIKSLAPNRPLPPQHCSRASSAL
jgi:hypothetical protein